jgi:hypothetical protein
MAADVISVDLPMTFKKRGGRKVIVLPDGTQGNPAPMATIDNTMIKAIAGHFAGRNCWRTVPTGAWTKSPRRRRSGLRS